MIIIPIILLLVLAAFYANSFIKKYKAYIFIVFLFLSIASIIFKDIPAFTPINQGFLGLSFINIVMFTTVLKDKTKLKTSLMKVRMEYTLLAFIVITPHVIYYLTYALDGSISIPIFGLIAYILMVISKLKMVIKKAKVFEYLTYIIYSSLSIHLILNSRAPNKILYIILFVIFIITKFMYLFKSVKKVKE